MSMRIEDCKIGSKVVVLGGEEGVIERVDYADYMVWVRLPPVNGVPQLVDLDPGDLRAVR
jgi:hypothetical protein